MRPEKESQDKKRSKGVGAVVKRTETTARQAHLKNEGECCFKKGTVVRALRGKKTKTGGQKEHGAPLMYSSQVSGPRAPSSAKSRPHLKQLGSRLAPAIAIPHSLALFAGQDRWPASVSQVGTAVALVDTRRDGPRALRHDWGLGRLNADGHVARAKVERSLDRVEQHWRPWHWRRRLVWRYTCGHKFQQTLTNKQRCVLQGPGAASLRVNMLIGRINLKHESLRRDPTWQAPLSTLRKPSSSHKPASLSDARPRGPWRVDDSCARETHVVAANNRNCA